MPTLLSILGKEIFSNLTTWITSARRVKEAKVQAEIARAEKIASAEIDWEVEAVRNSRTSWADELWHLWLFGVLTACFFEGSADNVQKGFTIINDYVPDFIIYGVGAAWAVAFGVRKLVDLVGPPRRSAHRN